MNSGEFRPHMSEVVKIVNEFGEIFVLKNSTHTCTIDAHRGSVTSVTSKVRIVEVILFSKS